MPQVAGYDWPRLGAVLVGIGADLFGIGETGREAAMRWPRPSCKGNVPG